MRLIFQLFQQTAVKMTALFCVAIFSVSGYAETQKMYGIQGANLTPRALPSLSSSYNVNGITYTTKSGEEAKQYSKQGIASYYHSKFNGRRTASGDTYNSSLYTAAHKTLPINSYALVTNLHNNRKVIVRINDRGPFSDNRIIDLSHAAAKELGLVARGMGNVKVEALQVAKNGTISGAGTKTLAKHAKTQKASDRLVLSQKSNSKAQEVHKDKNFANKYYKIKLKGFSTKKQAESLLKKLKLKNVKSVIRKNRQQYDIHFGPIKHKKNLNQLKSKIQKNANGKALVISTVKN